MNHMTRSSQLRIAVSLTTEAVAAEVRDRRPESVGLFGDLDEAQREQLALDAWTIGLRVLHNAHAAARESRLHEVGESLLAGIDRQLRAHIEQQQATIGAQSSLRSLNIETSDESIEAGSPIELSNDSFSNAVHSLPSGGRQREYRTRRAARRPRTGRG